jgi:SAM-dependent methyltransferase
MNPPPASPVASTLPEVDPEELKNYIGLVWSYRAGYDIASMIHLGHELGLYRALSGGDPVNAAELSQRTGLSERWLLEWLRGQAAARVLTYVPGTDGPGTGRFALPAVGEWVLADDDNLATAIGGFIGLPAQAQVLERLPDAFRTGRGLTYDDHGPTCAHKVERMLAPWHRHALVPRVLPEIDGLIERLEGGALAADVGCGAGLALITMAQAFPASQFHGYDLSRHAIERAEVNLAATDLTNVTFHLIRGEEMPADGRFDLVTTFDCIHDMTRPDLVIAQIRKALKADGIWLCADIKSAPTFEENLERNPMLGMMYAASVLSCMSSALSEPDGMGLGTLGFDPATAQRMATAAGFTSFLVHDVDNPANLYYEVRP